VGLTFPISSIDPADEPEDDKVNALSFFSNYIALISSGTAYFFMNSNPPDIPEDDRELNVMGKFRS
jgi:hypothetical protein